MKRVGRIDGWFGVLTAAAWAALAIPGACQGQGYTITTVAGGVPLPPAGSGTGDGGPATSAFLNEAFGVALDSSGNLYIAAGNAVRKVSPSGIVSTVAGDVFNSGYSGDGGPATSALLNLPYNIAVDAAGNLYIADTFNNRVRKVDPNGTIWTVAGGGPPAFGGVGDGGPATLATLASPSGVAVDPAGNLYIAEFLGFRVRKVSPNGTISTVAGCGLACFSIGDGGAGASAFVGPWGVALDGAGNVYISDWTNNRIRKLSPGGIITTVAGSGAGSYSGDGGAATQAGIYKPEGVALDTAGNLYIADSGDQRIRMVTPGGTISTIAGNGAIGSTGDGGPAASARLDTPAGIAAGTAGRVYFAQTATASGGLMTDWVIRMLTPAASATAPAIKPGGVVSAGSFGGFTSAAPGSWIEIYGSNLASGSRLWTGGDFSGIDAPTSLDGTRVSIGGQYAFIDYISPTQVNAQVPSGVAPGPRPVIVTTSVGSSAASTVTVAAQAPGLLAPSAFLVGGRQYVAALFSDGVTFVLPPGAIPGVPSRRAQPGDTVTLYGTGFGAVTPAIPAGQIVQQSNTLAAPFEILLGQVPATVKYDGLAPNAVGLYQFNLVVPNVVAGDAVPVTFTLAGVAGTQTLYIAVGN